MFIGAFDVIGTFAPQHYYPFNPAETIVIAFGVLCAAVLCVEFFLTWYQVGDDGIKSHGVLRRNFHLKWEDIERIGTKPPNSFYREYYIVVEGRGIELTLRSWLDGLPSFAAQVIEHVPEEKWKDARHMILRYNEERWTERNAS
ncbi:MAG TPA: hypothetical protein VMS79_03115 [Methanomassiliicoccales archaeon]|nr:hypothetical protein [Methanomassiliicoccales archaeon]